MKSLISKFLPVLLLAIVIFSSSCAQKLTFKTSTVAPAAEGYVKIKTDKNNNYVIKIHIVRLAEPSRLSPPKKAYVIWLLTEQNTAKNIGQVNTSTSGFSKQLKSSFETVSAFKPMKIFISAEDDATTTYPGNTLVLTTDKF